MSQYLGRVTVRVNGITLDSKPGASIDLGGEAREPQVTDQAMGFTVTPKPSVIECEIALKAGVSLEALRTLTDATLVFECDTKQRYIVKNGYTVNPPVISSGSVKVTFNGEPAQEMVA